MRLNKRCVLQDKLVESEKNSSALKGDALHVLILTSIAYLVAYSYEVSYLGYFGISADFAIIDVKTIIGAGIAVFAVFSIIYQLLDVISSFIKDNAPEGNLAKLFNRFGILFIPLVALVLISDMPLLNKLYMIFVPFPLFWFQVIYPIFERKKYGSYKEAQTAIIEHSKSSSDGLALKNSNESTKKYLMIMLIAIYAIFAASVAGSINASHQRDFFSVQEKEQILIRVYGETAILGELKSEKLSGTVIVRKLEGLTLTQQTYHTLVPEQDGKANFIERVKSVYTSFIEMIDY